MYMKEFEVRWSDVDANRHLANSAYINFMSHARMSYLLELGFDQGMMARHRIGPIVFHEHVYYFKEVFPGKPIRVSVELVGMSDDGKFFEFHHNFYDGKGRNMARCEMMGAWMSLETRRLTGLPTDLLSAFQKAGKARGFRTLTKEDTRKYARTPEDLE